jgi:hypothetical protein
VIKINNLSIRNNPIGIPIVKDIAKEITRFTIFLKNVKIKKLINNAPME